MRRELLNPKIAEHQARIVKTTAMPCWWKLRAWSMRFVAV
jgi:hypothetical protein